MSHLNADQVPANRPKFALLAKRFYELAAVYRYDGHRIARSVARQVLKPVADRSGVLNQRRQEATDNAISGLEFDQRTGIKGTSGFRDLRVALARERDDMDRVLNAAESQRDRLERLRADPTFLLAQRLRWELDSQRYVMGMIQQRAPTVEMLAILGEPPRTNDVDDWLFLAGWLEGWARHREAINGRSMRTASVFGSPLTEAEKRNPALVEHLEDCKRMLVESPIRLGVPRFSQDIGLSREFEVTEVQHPESA